METVVKLIGLTRCADTMVGDVMNTGISGGEKKRLTTAEMLVGPKPVLLMDEISTGWDAEPLCSGLLLHGLVTMETNENLVTHEMLL